MDLLKKLFKWNPKDRIGIKEVFLHPYFYEDPLPIDPKEIWALKRIGYYSKRSMGDARKKIKL